MIAKTELLQQANEALKQYQEQVLSLKLEQSTLHIDIDTIKEQLNVAIKDLVTHLVPDNKPESLANVSQVLALYMQEWYDRKVELNNVNTKLILELEATEDYSNAILTTDPVTGTLTVKQKDLLELIDFTKQSQEALKNQKHFGEFYITRNEEVSTLQKILNNFNGTNKRKSLLLQNTGYIDIYMMCVAYNQFSTDIETLKSEYQDIGSQITRIKSVVNQRNELHKSVQSFETSILPDVQNYVFNYILRSESLEDIRINCDRFTRILITTIIALKAKILVLTKSYNFVNSESISREKAKNSLQNNILKWKASKKTSFDLDANKYLVTNPSGYSTRTNLVINSSRSVRSRTINYVNYDHYDEYLVEHPNQPFWNVIEDVDSDPIPNFILERLIPDYNPTDDNELLANDAYQDLEVDESIFEVDDYNYTEPDEVMETSSSSNNDSVFDLFGNDPNDYIDDSSSYDD